MTRRIQPPTHQTTGHPYVDNVLRDEWREYRDYLTKMGAYESHWATFDVANYAAEDRFFIAPSIESPHLPRKLKKALVKQTLAAAFLYSVLDHYTPKGVLL